MNQTNLFDAPARTSEKPQRVFVPKTAPKPEPTLLEAVGAFLEARFKDRHYCDCMGLLPEHLDDCIIAPLMKAYRTAKREQNIQELGF